jgi:hypothetical protein
MFSPSLLPLTVLYLYELLAYMVYQDGSQPNNRMLGRVSSWQYMREGESGLPNYGIKVEIPIALSLALHRRVARMYRRVGKLHGPGSLHGHMRRLDR